MKRKINTQLTLTKQFLRNSPRLIVSPTWLSDGRWCVKKDRILHGDIITSRVAISFLDVDSYEMTDDQIDKVLPLMIDDRPLKKTRLIIKDHKTNFRLFVQGAPDYRYAFIEDSYCNFFGLDNIYPGLDINGQYAQYRGYVDSPSLNFTVLVMPLRVQEEIFSSEISGVFAQL